jgi:hypothetical protein
MQRQGIRAKHREAASAPSQANEAKSHRQATGADDRQIRFCIGTLAAGAF